MSTSNLPQGLHELGSEGIVPTEYLCGSAGTGKTFELRRRIAEDENYGILCATTGVAAMNLGAITLNSILGYFDTESLQESFFNGWLNKKIKDLAEAGYANIIIDEISMLDAKQLDIIYQAAKMVNEIRMMNGDRPIGIVLTGDFAQLSPIKAKWAFE